MAGAQVYHANPNSAQGAPQPPPPKPPRKNPYRDGQSKATQHYDLFEMIRHPHLAKANRPPDPPPKSLDSREKASKKKQHLKKRLEAKLEYRQKNAVGGLVTFLAVLTRLFFLVIVYPPYAVAYLIPKWVLTQAIPGVLKRIEQKIQQIFGGIKRSVTNLYRRSIDPVLRLWSNAKARFKGSAEEVVPVPLEEMGFFAFIAHGLFQFYFSTVHPLYQAIRLGIYKLRKFIEEVRKLPTTVRQVIVKRIEKLQGVLKAIRGLPNKIAKRIAQAFQQSIALPLKNRLQKIQARCKDAYRRSAKVLEQLTEGLVQTLLHPIQTVKTKLRTVGGRLQRLKETVSRAFKNRWTAYQQRLNQYKNQLKASFETYLTLPLRKKKQAIALRLRRIQEGVKSRFAKLSNALQKLIQQLKGFHPRNLLPRWNVSFKMDRFQIKESALLKALKAYFSRRKAAFVAYGQRKAAQVRTALHLITTPLNNSWVKFKANAQAKWTAVKQAFQPLVHLGKRIQRRVRVAMAWGAVLLNYGFSQVTKKS